jgi:excisionase family DNA binding protein
MTDAMYAESWFTVERAARFLDVSEPTIWRWMREGRLSHFKVGKATRFKIEDLEAVARRVTAKQAGRELASRCAVCGHGFLLAGDVRSTGKVYFQPERTKFWVLAESMVELRAYACPVCGHVQVHADAEQLAKLMKPEDAAASRDARAGTTAGTEPQSTQRTQRDAEDNNRGVQDLNEGNTGNSNNGDAAADERR